MKIIPGKYKEEPNWQKWLKFKNPEGCRLSVVFLRRLAALARDMGIVMENLIGNRSTVEQQVLYNADLKAHGGKPSGKVAAPGVSWHENHCAVDLDGPKWRNISNAKWMPFTWLKQTLNAYGLMLPLNRVDSPSVLEWWHLQPIETNGIPGSKRKAFLDQDDEVFNAGMSVKEFQAAMGLVADGIAGPATKAKAKEVFQCCQGILEIPVCTTAEDVINATQNTPGLWLGLLKTLKYFDNFVMNIYKKMRGE